MVIDLDQLERIAQLKLDQRMKGAQARVEYADIAGGAVDLRSSISFFETVRIAPDHAVDVDQFERLAELHADSFRSHLTKLAARAAGMVVEDPGLARRVRPIQERGAATLAHIEAVALEVIIEKGRDGFTMQDVTNRVKCSTGTVYRYFANRVELLDAVWPDRRDR